MKNDNFYKTLRILCLILAIVCMALSLIKKANAEDIDQSLVERYFSDQFLQANNINDVSILNSLVESGFIYFIEIKYNDNIDIYWITKGKIACPLDFNISDQVIYDVSLYKHFGSNETYYNAIDGRSLASSVGQGNAFGYYVVYDHYNKMILSCSSMVYSTGYDGTIADYNGTGYNNFVQDGTVYYNATRTSNGYYYVNVSFANKNINSTDTKANYHNYWFKRYSNSGNVLILDNYFDLNEYYPSTNTDGFDVYKYGSENNQRLVCDFTNCISISSAVGNSSTISLILNIDSVETTFNFDSSSEYYYYGPLGNEAARYSFPFSVLGITANTINARLISVNVINTTSHVGGSYNKSIWWVTPITLVGSNYEDETASVISKDTLPNYDHFDDPATQQSYKETTNRWLTSTYNTLPLSLFNRWNFEVKYKVIPVYQEGLGSAALNAFLTAITQTLNLQFGDVVETAIELYNGHSIYEIIDDILLNNNYAEYYDLIAFCYQDANGSYPVYYIYTTDSYNNHLTNSYLYDIMQTIYDDGKALDSIYNYLYDRLDDFEIKSLNKMNEAVGLGEIENNLLEKIRKLLEQILAAILNLDLEVPEADFTDILSKLDTIIDNQDSSDINDDWYQNYREWLYGINENDSYLSPHEYFNNIFGTLKTTFDSFTNNISFNAYLLKVEDFINHISGTTTDNLTIYLRDGIGDPGFNINNNYMYTVGGSQ